MRSFLRVKHFSFLLSVLLTNVISAGVIYVDNQLSGNCTGNYSIANHNCSGTDGNAYNTIAGAAAAAVAGDMVLIRGGVYNEQLAPQNSGSAGSYITFKNYGTEHVVISGNTLNPAVWIDQKNYIVVQGIVVRDVVRFLNALGCTNLIIQNDTFQYANDGGGSSKTGLFFQASNYNKILNNYIDSTTQDNIGMVDCDYNLIEGNTIKRAAHTLWTFKCSNYNVIRKNYFHNQLQKIGEIYDCDYVGYGNTGFPKITSVDDTKYNVVEDNIFAFTFTPIDHSPYAGIQYAAQHGIIRRNIFYNCIGPPIDISLYSGEAEYNYGNRIYNNVMYNNHFGAIGVPADQGSYTCYDNTVRNNIFYRNNFVQYDHRWTLYDTLNNKPLQVMVGGSSSILSTATSAFDNNDIFSSQQNELYTIVYGDRAAGTNPPPYSVQWWQANHSGYFRNNLQADPLFMDTLTKDFHLKSTSTMIDAGRFLAKTAGAGTIGTTMIVDSAGYFMDGFGIQGLSGDTIQLQGQTQMAVITSINYATNTFTLSSPLTWTSGQKISLKYYGTAPDLGAFEYHSSSGTSGINNGVMENGNFSIYPNPSNGQLNFSFANSSGKINATINVFNSGGSLIYSGKASNTTIDLSSVAKGIYLIQLITDNAVYNKKIVIE